jgi:hypothetical protein
MIQFAKVARTATVTAALVLGVLAPVLAQGQPMPSYASPDSAPPPNQSGPPSYGQNWEVIEGRIAGIPGKYDIDVRDSHGYIDHIRLHDGTIITPTGLTLSVGMGVRVFGVNQGQVFAANQIDTPYQNYGYAYPAYGAYSAYPAWGYGGAYPWWGGIGIGIGVGWGGYYGGWRGWGCCGGWGYRGWSGWGGYHGWGGGGWHGGGWHGWR